MQAVKIRFFYPATVCDYRRNSLRKHKNDVFRLTELLDRNRKTAMYVPNAVLGDVRAFIERMALEEVDLKQLGILGKTKEAILEELRSLYG